jgi:hypothetical protein
VRQIARDLNRLLDRWATESAATSPKRSAVDTDLRLLLLWWMDQDRAPALVWATDGHVVAMNKAMQALESTPIDPSGGVAEGWVSEAIGSSNLCVVRPAAPPKP